MVGYGVVRMMHLGKFAVLCYAMLRSNMVWYGHGIVCDETLSYGMVN